MNPKKALIDGDIIAYRCAASCEPMSTKPEREPLHFAIQRMDELMWKILATMDVTEQHTFLSGGDNFRKIIYPEYKANRKDQRIPEYLNECRNFLTNEWKAETVGGYEADDGIAMNHDVTTVIVSIDKDFKQLPGLHYHFVKDLIDIVDEDQANLNFWKQMLIGDKADNVQGVAGIGEVKSERLLKDLTPDERAATVYDLYNDPERFTLNFKLFRLLRSVDEYNEIIEEAHLGAVKESEGAESTEAGKGEAS